MDQGRATYSAGNFALRIAGADGGLLRSIEGGEPFTPVITEPPTGGVVGKHLGAVQYAPFVLEIPGR